MVALHLDIKMSKGSALGNFQQHDAGNTGPHCPVFVVKFCLYLEEAAGRVNHGSDKDDRPLLGKGLGSCPNFQINGLSLAKGSTDPLLHIGNKATPAGVHHLDQRLLRFAGLAHFE